MLVLALLVSGAAWVWVSLLGVEPELLAGHLPKLRMTAGCGTLDDQGRSMHWWTTLS